MKKTVINFHPPLYTLCFFALFLLTSCQKETIQPNFIENTSKSNSIDKSAEAHELDLSGLAAQMNSNARADSWVIMNEIIQVTDEGPYLIGINVEHIPVPRTHRLDVTIIPFDKPTDLILQSIDPERNPIGLDIKESGNPGMQTDFVKFRQNDFLIGETNAVIKIEWEGTGNQFEVKINAVPVDCEEDAPRRQGDVGIEYQPVCGCDGRTYFDATTAYNAGITSYDRGQCLPNPLIPIEGIWEALNPDRIGETLEFLEDCIGITIWDIDENGNEEVQYYLVCPEEETGNDKYEVTFTVTDKNVEKGFPLIWPVEKWFVQVNGQRELEIVRTNGAANKDKKEDKQEHATILSRYKRIK